MEIKKSVFFQSGKNEGGQTWSVKLEIPVFDIGRIDAFYEKVRACLTKRALDEGVNVFSFLTVTYVGEKEVSLYSDILFCRGRILEDMIRLTDNRHKDGTVVPPPKRGARSWYRLGDVYYTGKVNFTYDPNLQVKRSDYKRYITERVLRVSSPSANQNVDDTENEHR